jgi:hypothetical protein
MILSKCIPPVKELIRRAAELRRPVPFPDLYALFPKGTPPQNVYTTLEAACEELSPWSEAIYSVVLAKKDTGLPGDGFFNMFLLHRSEEYKAIAGDTSTLDLTLDQREKMVALEKPRVYAHAMP